MEELKKLVTKTENLNQKAIPNSRGKNALAMLKRKETEKIEKKDPFQNQ